MPLPVIIVTAIIGIGCVLFLLMDPLERSRSFLNRSVGKLFYPHLAPLQRQKKITVFIGLLLATLLTAAILIFAIKHLGRV